MIQIDQTETIRSIARLDAQMAAVLAEVVELRRELRALTWRVALLSGLLGALGGLGATLGVGVG